MTEPDKATLRASMRERRAAWDPAVGVRLAPAVLAWWAHPPDAVIGGFWPLPGEIDIRPLLDALMRRGHLIALPETPRRGEALTFHRWAGQTPLIPGRFGTWNPTPDPVIPDLVLVPLLAFDRAGRRLGYGAGYYDRTLAALPASHTLGCAFAAQEVAAVPVEPHDRRLDAIATEVEVIVVERD